RRGRGIKIPTPRDSTGSFWGLLGASSPGDGGRTLDRARLLPIAAVPGGSSREGCLDRRINVAAEVTPSEDRRLGAIPDTLAKQRVSNLRPRCLALASRAHRCAT